MNSDYPERKHESPFADYHPEQHSPDSSPQSEPRGDNSREVKTWTNGAANLNNTGSERRMIPQLDYRIEVVYRRGANVPMILILLFLSIFITIPILASSIRNALYLAIFFNVCFVGFLAAFIFYRKRQLARSFDSSGATRGDGRFFAWSNFRGTVTRWSSSRSMGKTIWRIELYFVGGQIWISPGTMKNGEEVLDFVKSLPALLPTVLKN